MPLTNGVPPSNSSPNSKRASKMSTNQSLNHLLNFTLPPRQPHFNVPRRSNRKTSSNTAFGVRSTERFVNAQYRFMMKPSGDYTVHFADPDIFFQWHDILQVIIARTSAIAAAGSHIDDEGLTACPICLSPPTAPRMTKCGHVFCLPCILHYLNVSDIQKWIRCPICFDSVNEKQLKSVKWFDSHLCAQGEECREIPQHVLDISPSSSEESRLLKMRLMFRPQITTLALPRSSTWPSELLTPHQAPFHFLPDVFAFSKFMLATPTYLIAELTKDLDDLAAERRTLADMRDELGILFIDAAESKVRSQIQEVEAMDTDLLKRTVDKAHHQLADIQQRHERLQQASSQSREAMRSREDTPGEMLSPVGIQTITPATPRAARQRRNVNPPPPSTSTYYYYQSAAGSPIFLHPLDIRILLSHFNSYPAFPDEITVKVEAFSEGTVSTELRKRCKYLALPDGADVVFVEANLESVVGAEGLKNFEGALKTRRAKRKEKGRKDDRAKSRAEDKERDELEKVYGAPQWSRYGGLDGKIPPDWSSSAPEAEEGATSLPAQQSHPGGAWGSRSFASALHSSPSTHSMPRGQRHEEEVQDAWDVDVAWHEMEQRTGGRKNGRKPKMVVLGGGPGASRRR